MKKNQIAILAGAACLAAAGYVISQVPGQPRLGSQPINRMLQIPTQKTGELKLTGTPLTAFASSDSQMFGAGRNKVVLLGEDGKVQKEFATDAASPTIAPHGKGQLVVGDTTNGILIGLNLATGKSSPLLKLSEIKDPDPSQMPSGQMIGDGQFSAVGSDGKNVFIALEAGFSSMIFKVDPATKQIVGRGFAGAPDPSAMNFHDGQLFLLAGEGSKVLRFNEALVKTHENIDLPSKGNFGLGVKSGEIRTLGSNRSVISKLSVDTKATGRANLVQYLDRVRLVVIPDIGIKFPPLNFAKRYAVLICGDLAENFAGECFWNDTVWMYKTLLNNGYKKEDIFVLYGDGADYLSANAAYRHPYKVTNFAATATNVRMMFDGLRLGNAGKGIPKMDSNDTLFLWTFDHGGSGTNPATGGTDSTLGLRGGAMWAKEFADKANAITYGSRAVFMQQCYSGGFIPRMQNSKTFISTACMANEVARPADTENETVSGKSYSHGEFNYHITTALNRLKTSPPGGAINADANADTFVSAKEMQVWNTGHESRPETPVQNDMGGIGSLFKFKK